MIDITDSKQLNTHFNNKFPDEILAHLSAYLRTPNPNQSLMKDIESYSITRTFLKKMDSYRGLYQGTFKGQTIEKQEEEQEEDQQRRRGRNRFWASNTIEERGYYIESLLKESFVTIEEDYFDIEVYYGQKYLDRKDEIDFLVQTGQITEEEEYQEREYVKTLYFFNLLRHVCNNLLFEKEEGAKYMKHFYENDRKYFKNVMNAITRDRRNQNRY
jgi:hypothetical protein